MNHLFEERGYPNEVAATLDFAEQLAARVIHYVNQRGECHLVFPGGQSPIPVMRALAELPVPWDKLHLYPTDERCLPAGNAERNDRIIDRWLIPATGFPKAQLYRIPGELGPSLGASSYDRLLKSAPVFDIAWLGVGRDGHTASLFAPLSEQAVHGSVAAVKNSPKPPSRRISIGLRRLRDARERWLLLDRVRKPGILEALKGSSTLPIALAQPTRVFVF
jgi:6-phosphogluconolactonase